MGVASELISDVAEHAAKVAAGRDVKELRDIQRALVLLARDATAAASALYSPIRVAEQETEIRKVLP